MNVIKQGFYKFFTSMTIGYAWFTLSMFGVVLTYNNVGTIQVWCAVSCFVALAFCFIGSGSTNTVTNMRLHGMEYHTHTTEDTALSVGVLYGFTWSFVLLILYWICELWLNIINVTPMWYIPIVVVGIPSMICMEWYISKIKKKSNFTS